MGYHLHTPAQRGSSQFLVRMPHTQRALLLSRCFACHEVSCGGYRVCQGAQLAALACKGERAWGKESRISQAACYLTRCAVLCCAVQVIECPLGYTQPKSKKHTVLYFESSSGA